MGAKCFPYLERVTRKEFRCGHSPATFALQRDNAQRLLATPDHDSALVGTQDLSR